MRKYLNRTANNRRSAHRILWQLILTASMISLAACSQSSGSTPEAAASSTAANSEPEVLIATSIAQPSEPANTNPPESSLVNYLDEDFKLALDYPESWNLSVETAGDGSPDSAKALRFQKESNVLVVYYKHSWDTTGLGGGLPLGEVEDRGSVSLLGTSIPRHFLVHEGKVKVMFCSERFDDLEFYIHLTASTGPNETYYDIDLPEFLFSEVDTIISSIRRIEN